MTYYVETPNTPIPCYHFNAVFNHHDWYGKHNLSDFDKLIAYIKKVGVKDDIKHNLYYMLNTFGKVKDKLTILPKEGVLGQMLIKHQEDVTRWYNNLKAIL